MQSSQNTFFIIKAKASSRYIKWLEKVFQAFFSTINMECLNQQRYFCAYRQGSILIFQQSILQRHMQSLVHSSIAQMDRISELLSYYLQTSTNLSKSALDIRKQKRFADQKPIQTQINELKWNINKIAEICQSLQNENRVLKRMITRSGPGSSMYFGEKQNNSSQIENCLLNKYLSKVTSSHYSSDIQMSSFQQNPSQVRLFDSSARFERIKQEVNVLSEGIKSIKKAYDKYELDSTDDREIKDMFSDEHSLVRFESSSDVDHKLSCSREQQISLEHLLCDEELSMEEIPLQEKCIKRVRNEQNMVESLIAKGIEFRQCRTMSSKEYQTLSGMIGQYREEIKKKGNVEVCKVQGAIKYR